MVLAPWSRGALTQSERQEARGPSKYLSTYVATPPLLCSYKITPSRHFCQNELWIVLGEGLPPLRYLLRPCEGVGRPACGGLTFSPLFVDVI